MFDGESATGDRQVTTREELHVRCQNGVMHGRAVPVPLGKPE